MKYLMGKFQVRIMFVRANDSTSFFLEPTSRIFNPVRHGMIYTFFEKTHVSFKACVSKLLQNSLTNSM